MGTAIEMSGGSVGNSIAGVASFEGKAGYLGRVCDDQLGGVLRTTCGLRARRVPGPPARRARPPAAASSS